jgi:hypothetical protein
MAWLEVIRGAQISGADLVVADLGGVRAFRSRVPADKEQEDDAALAIQLPAGFSDVLSQLGPLENTTLRPAQLSFALLNDGATAVVRAALDSGDTNQLNELLVAARLEIGADGRFLSPVNGDRRHRAVAVTPDPDPVDALANPTNRYVAPTLRCPPAAAPTPRGSVSGPNRALQRCHNAPAA